MAPQNLALMFPDQKFHDAKLLLTTVKPWWKRYLDRFEPVPIMVPRSDDDQWRARISIAEHSLTMYVDVNFAMEASLTELAGSIEHELQRSRRRFDERENQVPEAARGEYWRIASRMEVASALTNEYEHSSLAHRDLLSKLLNGSATFGPSLVEKYDVDELPVSDMTWMPEMLDLESNKSAEEYAIEMARRDGLLNDNHDDADSGDDSDTSDDGDGDPSDDVDDQSTSADDGSNSAGSGDSGGNDESVDDDDDSDAQNGNESADSGESGDADDDATDGQDSGDGGATDGQDSESADGDSESSRSDGNQEDDAESATGDATDDYSQLNTDNGEGTGRSGGWQGRNASGQEMESTTSDALTNEDGSAMSTGIEESNQIASSDGRTDRASSGTEGNISNSSHESTVADQIKQMKQENPALEWDANKSHPEVYDPHHSDDVDEFEAAESTLEQSEREQADQELIEDVKSASLAQDFDPAAPLSPSFGDIDIADEELHRRGIHWTDFLSEALSSSVTSMVLKGSDDYSYAQRNPNQSLTGPILMGGISYTPTVYALFDTSGSMMRHLTAEKELLADLLESVNENYQARVCWFAANTNIYSAGESNEFDLDLARSFAYSGGGTSFCDDLNDLIAGDFHLDDQAYDEPDVLVILSDMEFRWTGAVAKYEPDIPVIRVIPAQSLVAKRKRNTQRLFEVPDWIYDQDNLVEMV